ncbi:hypothetical protein F8388_024809 [Cannabis sativa]|uniref:Citrate transporter-like domain-containing protein n=1 Tax=Cannabis sativa TaxID=3483 RepID=A0A7J6DZ92_CANSA|nr:hypothetical protein F8388_024809 [Cannabis sativa]
MKLGKKLMALELASTEKKYSLHFHYYVPIGRTAGSLLGAILMIIFKVITPDEAYDAIYLSVLGFLFGTMVFLGIYLDKADMFKYIAHLLSWKSQGPKDVVCRICIISALLSALFTNDTTCIVLTEFVLRTAKQSNVPPHPFLLALASSANIGSAATPIGNPQNLVIAIQSKISFGQFLLGLLPLNSLMHLPYLSSLASNVPTVLRLGGRVAAMAAAISPHEVKKSWLILGWVSTVAGNLSLPGSAANLIVCEQARLADPSFNYTLSFWTHLKFGLPSTIIVTTIGLTLLIRG